MVGPSSSHTAGAVKLGQMARALFDTAPKKVTFILHGSFASVYKGHATDKALIAGIMKFHTSDEKIKDAFKIADEKGIKYEFQTANLGINYHPNTVKIVMEAEGRAMSVIGSSVGGGAIIIKKIDDFDIDLSGIAGKAHTIAISHSESAQSLAAILNLLAQNDCKIINIQSSRVAETHKVFTLISFKDQPNLPLILDMEKMEGVYFVRSLNKIC